MPDAPVLTVDPLNVDAVRVGDILRRTSPWARFVAVMYFLGAALMLVMGLGGVVMAVVSQRPQMLVAGIYPIFALLYLIPAIYLWRFTARANEFATGLAPMQLEQALDAQRSYWKTMGIFMIVGMVCAVVVFFGAMVAGIWFARAQQG